MLLTDLTSAAPIICSVEEPLTDYSQERWKLLPDPQLRTVNQEHAKKMCQPKIGILVATDVERQAVLKKMRLLRKKRMVLQVFFEILVL
jgi:hypothetical protein